MNKTMAETYMKSAKMYISNSLSSDVQLQIKDSKMYSTYYKASLESILTGFDLGFCRWIDIVEAIVFKKTGFYLLDLQDEMYMPNFENKMSAEEMANIVIKTFNEEYDQFMPL